VNNVTYADFLTLDGHPSTISKNPFLRSVHNSVPLMPGGDNSRTSDTFVTKASHGIGKHHQAHRFKSSMPSLSKERSNTPVRGKMVENLLVGDRLVLTWAGKHHH
jgi:hypothetical protein